MTSDITVSCFENYYSTAPKEVNLWEWLKDPSYKNEIEFLRTLSNKDDIKRIKSGLPCITPSGNFVIRHEAGLTEHSGLIRIDIDADDNPHVSDFEDLRDELSKIVNVAYSGLSASGRGVFCLIPIAYTDKHKEHFDALKLAFEKIGIVVDKACRDVSRLRGYSYDLKGYFNMDAVTYSQVYKHNLRLAVTVPMTRKKSHYGFKSNSQDKTEKIIAKITATDTDITGDYNQWFQIGCALANEFGEEGREMFHNVSMYSEKYKIPVTDSQFNKCLEGNYEYSIGTFFHWAEEYNMI